jgi:hypothetical protein
VHAQHTAPASCKIMSMRQVRSCASNGAHSLRGQEFASLTGLPSTTSAAALQPVTIHSHSSRGMSSTLYADLAICALTVPPQVDPSDERIDKTSRTTDQRAESAHWLSSLSPSHACRQDRVPPNKCAIHRAIFGGSIHCSMTTAFSDMDASTPPA